MVKLLSFDGVWLICRSLSLFVWDGDKNRQTDNYKERGFRSRIHGQPF